MVQNKYKYSTTLATNTQTQFDLKVRDKITLGFCVKSATRKLFKEINKLP